MYPIVYLNIRTILEFGWIWQCLPVLQQAGTFSVCSRLSGRDVSGLPRVLIGPLSASASRPRLWSLVRQHCHAECGTARGSDELTWCVQQNKHKHESGTRQSEGVEHGSLLMMFSGRPCILREGVSFSPFQAASTKWQDLAVRREFSSLCRVLLTELWVAEAKSLRPTGFWWCILLIVVSGIERKYTRTC